jgi:hypothetical protein
MRRIKKVTYKTITKPNSGTSRDIGRWLAERQHVTIPFGPPNVGDVVPSTSLFADRVIKMHMAVIYAIGPIEASPLKIGCARHVKSRRDALQQGQWVQLLIHRAVFAGFRSNAFQLEAALFRRFKRERIRGDWFSIDLGAFDAAIREVVHGRG